MLNTIRFVSAALVLAFVAACGPTQDQRPAADTSAPPTTTAPAPAAPAPAAPATEPTATADPLEPSPSEPSRIDDDGTEAEHVPADVDAVEDIGDVTATITLDNLASDAWLVQEVDGAVEVDGEENPTITLQVGERYRFVNPRSDLHPLSLRDGDGEMLLSEGGEGAFANDAAVDFTQYPDGMAFTLTDSLAAQLQQYVCDVHFGSMVGRIEVAGGSPSD